MEKVASSFNFSTIEKVMGLMVEDHSTSTLGTLKRELNKFFIKVPCKDIIYTDNTDKLFFGMRVYVVCDGTSIMTTMGDSKTVPFSGYYLELDSKLFDPMLALDEKELTAILLHEIGHIAYDTETIDEVKKQVDMYFAKMDENIDLKASKGYRELLAYAMKDSVMKVGSIFSKVGDTEMIADAFVAACGYGPYLESGFKKISTSATYLNKSVDNRLITLGWVLRLNSDFKLRRMPAIRTLNKAKMLTGSELEKKELAFASNILSRMDEPVYEGALDNIKERFSKKFKEFKFKGVRSIKNDIYELNLRLRAANSEEDLLYIIRTLNTDIAIIRDYMTEDISEEEREDCLRVLQEMYDIRERAAKQKEIRDRYDSLISIYYPDM